MNINFKIITRLLADLLKLYQSITISDNFLTAENCQIIDCSEHDLSFPDIENRINTQDKYKSIVIKDNVWIGANSIILSGITIGIDSIISANSIINKSIPPVVITDGNPAKIILIEL